MTTKQGMTALPTRALGAREAELVNAIEESIHEHYAPRLQVSRRERETADSKLQTAQRDLHTNPRYQERRKIDSTPSDEIKQHFIATGNGDCRTGIHAYMAEGEVLAAPVDAAEKAFRDAQDREYNLDVEVENCNIRTVALVYARLCYQMGVKDMLNAVTTGSMPDALKLMRDAMAADESTDQMIAAGLDALLGSTNPVALALAGGDRE